MRTIQIPLILATFTFLFTTSSCIDEMFLEGNGVVKSEIRVASGFDEVVSSGDFQVTVMPGGDYSVEVSAESNLLPYIETDVIGNTLKIRTRGIRSLRQNVPIVINITTPVLNGLTLSGSGLIQTGSFLSSDFRIDLSGSGNVDAQISSDRIKANVSGSGTIFLEGAAVESNFVISGSGKIKSYKLEQSVCRAVISGSGDMFVNASESLDASISGSGRVFYIGNPVIHTSISGSGGVVNKN